MTSRSMSGVLGFMLGMAVLISGCGSSDTTAAPASGLFVPGNSKAALAEQTARQQGHPDQAQLIHRIAGQPLATWIGQDNTQSAVDSIAAAAAARNQIPVLVAYDIPERDCDNFSKGGASSPAEYRQFIQNFASGLAGRPALIVLEPDAIPHAVTGCDSVDVSERYSLLAEAVSTFKNAGPGVKVYLDAGNPGFIRDPHLDDLAYGLQRSGIDQADGFALNVANYYTTAENVSYGQALSRLVDGKHFVIDTSRNGRGFNAQGLKDSYCNQPGRALGQAPTLNTGIQNVDALLWVKLPGESDGTCRGGTIPAGSWDQNYALKLAATPPN